MKRTLAATATAVIIAVVGLFIWLDRLFEEPSAKHVSSLVAQLNATSVLGVFGHPDDEVFAAGMLADAAGRENVVVRMITATRGEAARPDPPISRQEDLGVVRHAEVIKHGFALGLDEQEVWRYPDGDLERVSRELMTRLVARIRGWKPDLVVTFDPASGYTLHPDHLAIGSATTKAIRAANDQDFAPSLGPPYRVAWLAYLLVPRPAVRTFRGKVGREIASKQRGPNFSVPASAHLKIRGWRIHQSQHTYMRHTWGLPTWFIYRLFDKEHFLVQSNDEGAG